MNVGILSPRSNAHPNIGIDFLDGIKIFLKSHELDEKIKLHHESVGLGGNEKDVYEKTEKLLFEHEVHVIVAFIDLRVLPILEPLMYTSGKLFIIVNPGANYPHSWVAKPNVLFLTLHDAFLSGLTGMLAAEAHKISATASTFYDCGYLHTASMNNSYTRAGGQVLYHYINQQRPYNDGFEIPELASFLEQNEEVRSVLCVFDSLPASIFYKRVNQFPFASDMNLYVSPMMLEKKALEHLLFSFTLAGHVTWSPNLSHKANTDFLDSVEKSGKSATLFTVLGWETAIILNQLLTHDNNGPVPFIASVMDMVWDTPRGEMRLDGNTNYLTTPAYKCIINPGEQPVFQPVEIDDEWKLFTAMPLQGVSSGWTNTYLCY